jgi:hypothetical protein
MDKNPSDKYNIAAFGYKKAAYPSEFWRNRPFAQQKKNTARFTLKNKSISPRVSDRDRRPTGYFMIIAQGLEIILWPSSIRYCHLSIAHPEIRLGISGKCVRYLIERE